MAGIFVFIASIVIGIAAVPIPVTAADHQADRAFIENKGQIGDQYGLPNDSVRFLIVRPGLNIQLKASGFSYDSYSVDRCPAPTEAIARIPRFAVHGLQHEDVTYHVHRVDVELVGSNPLPIIEAREPSADHLNYYTHITEQRAGYHGVTGVRGYGRIRYSNVWPGIDLEWFLNHDGEPEYQFIVQPGADPEDIRLRYHGANAMELLAGSVVIHVMHGPIVEKIPRSFLAKSDRPVDVQYRFLDGNTIGFTVASDVKHYAAAEGLVIDPAPQRQWSTYYGGQGNDYGTGIVALDDENIIMVGNTEATNAIATSGVHQSSFAGSEDVFITKIWQWQRGGIASPVRRWGTYYGGRSMEWSTGMAKAHDDGLVVVGFTRSTNGIATDGAHQTTFGGDLDAFIAVLDTSGQRRWGSYLGGPAEDDATAVAVDTTGTIAVVGSTSSTSGIATVGAHRDTLAGELDAFVVTFSSGGVRQRGTYYGGRGQDIGLAVDVTTDGGIVLAGRTGSAFGIATGGTHQESIGGDYDAYVVKLGADGKRQWASYNGGRGADDVSDLAVCIDGDILLVGSTFSAEGIASPGAHMQTYGGNRDVLLTRFDPFGRRRWGTYFGGDGDDDGYAVHGTEDGHAVIAGSTGSTKGIADVGGTWSRYQGGPQDAFFAMFNRSGTWLSGAYYGDVGSDKADDVVVTSNLVVTIVGSVNESRNQLSTFGAHQEEHGDYSPRLTSLFDAYLARFMIDPSTSVHGAARSIQGETTMHNAVRLAGRNPVVDGLVLEYSIVDDGVLDMVSSEGQLVASIPVSAAQSSVHVSTAGIASGLYCLVLRTAHETGRTVVMVMQ